MLLWAVSSKWPTPPKFSKSTPSEVSKVSTLCQPKLGVGQVRRSLIAGLFAFRLWPQLFYNSSLTLSNSTCPIVSLHSWVSSWPFHQLLALAGLKAHRWNWPTSLVLHSRVSFSFDHCWPGFPILHASKFFVATDYSTHHAPSYTLSQYCYNAITKCPPTASFPLLPQRIYLFRMIEIQMLRFRLCHSVR